MECSVTDFILQSYIDTNICDELIEYYHQSEDKFVGTLSSGVNLKKKVSTEVLVPEGELLKKYFNELQKVAELYVEKFIFSEYYETWTVIENVKLQHYKPGEGFFVWHAERTTDALPVSARHLVFMTYLNDVVDGGETEFYYQKLKIKPKKGLTLIWPADWTHTHRGITSEKKDKYIITGWFSYYRK
jgi:hypothetical protein